jgi:hypothetical protein
MNRLKLVQLGPANYVLLNYNEPSGQPGSTAKGFLRQTENSAVYILHIFPEVYGSFYRRFVDHQDILDGKVEVFINAPSRHCEAIPAKQYLDALELLSINPGLNLTSK